MHYLQNPYFWAGELGLFLCLVSGIVLLYRFRHDGPVSIAPVFFAVIMTLSLLVHPVIRADVGHGAPSVAYLYRLALGVLVASLTWRYTFSTILKAALPEEIRQTRNVLKWAAVAGTMFVSLVIWKLKNR